MDYESPQLRAVTGTAIRPGGPELTGRAMEFCSFPAGARILDVGCGEGATVGFLRSHYNLDAAGVDISSCLLRDGKSLNASLPLMRASAERLPYDNESLDGILCECVLSLVPDPQCALAEFHRALRPGGHLILSDVYLIPSPHPASGPPLPEGEGTIYPSPSGRRVRDEGGRVHLTGHEELIREAGFSVLLWEDHTRHLKELAARLVLAGASSGVFCKEFTKVDGGHRPGYYLLVARRQT